ncbi:hypothetical protein D3C73_1133280 [compost metagenome]
MQSMDFLAGDHSSDSCQGAGGRSIDAENPCVRMWAPQDLRVKHPGLLDVHCVDGAPGDFGGAVQARAVASDDRRIVRRGRNDDPVHSDA